MMNMKNVPFVLVSFLSLFAIHPITNFLGTDNDGDDEQYFINISNYSSNYRSPDNQPNIRMIKKVLVSLAIENSLLTIGKGTHATIINHLRTMCNNSSLLDCFEHPDYLNTVLKTSGDDIYRSNISLIKAKLKELANDEEISEFLRQIGK
jgi:hypothetical protein